jgi:hypothetical protein
MKQFEKEILKIGKRNLWLYIDKDRTSFFSRPKKWYLSDGGVECLGVEFTLFGILFLFFYSCRQYRTWCDS